MMTDQFLFPAPVTTTDHLEGVVSGKSETSVTTHDQTYGSLPTPQEIKDLLAGLSGKQIGSSGQELTSGVDYWKNSTGIEDLKNKISLPVNTGSSDLKLSNSKLHIVSLMVTNEADKHKLATGAGGGSGVEASGSENVSVEGHPSGGGFIGGTSGGSAGNNEPGEHIHVTGRRYLTVHGLNAEEINGKIFLRGPDGKGLLTEKNNDGSYSSQPLEIIEKDLKQITQDIYGRDPTDDDYRSYNNLLQNSKSPQEARGNFSHSSDADNRLKTAISDIQGRNATEGDRPWLNAQEDALGNGQTSLKDIYKGTAAWTADHGGYDQIFEQIHGRAPTAQDRSYAATRIGDGWSVQTYRWNEAHSDDTKFTLSRIIEQVQDRQVTPGDSAWITGQQDDIGNSKQSMNDIRPALAKWSADHGAYDDVFSQVHGRPPSQADRDYAAARIGGNWSVQDYRWNEAHSDETLNRLQNMIPAVMGHAYQQEFNQPWRDQTANAIGASNYSIQKAAIDLAKLPEALTKIDAFLIKEFNSTSQDLRDLGSKILGNVAFYQHQISNYSQDMLHSLADNYKSQFVLSDNILKSMMPQTVEQWLGLTAMLALMLNPPGDVALVGGALAIGGEQLLNDTFNILESRFLTDVETKSTQIISSEGKKFVIEDVAKSTAPHVEKHIDELDNPSLSLRNDGITNIDEIENYLQKTLNDAPNHPERYEVASDIRNDRLAIWDKETNTMTIFNPKGNKDTKGFGTAFKPEGGYRVFEEVKNGR